MCFYQNLEIATKSRRICSKTRVSVCVFVCQNCNLNLAPKYVARPKLTEEGVGCIEACHHCAAFDGSIAIDSLQQQQQQGLFSHGLPEHVRKQRRQIGRGNRRRQAGKGLWLFSYIPTCNSSILPIHVAPRITTTLSKKKNSLTNFLSDGQFVRKLPPILEKLHIKSLI